MIKIWCCNPVCTESWLGYHSFPPKLGHALKTFLLSFFFVLNADLAVYKLKTKRKKQKAQYFLRTHLTPCAIVIVEFPGRCDTLLLASFWRAKQTWKRQKVSLHRTLFYTWLLGAFDATAKLLKFGIVSGYLLKPKPIFKAVYSAHCFFAHKCVILAWFWFIRDKYYEYYQMPWKKVYLETSILRTGFCFWEPYFDFQPFKHTQLRSFALQNFALQHCIRIMMCVIHFKLNNLLKEMSSSL